MSAGVCGAGVATRGARAWVGLGSLLGGVAGLAAWATAAPSTCLDWQPSLAFGQPWRAFTAVAVHYSTLHLAANLAGTVLVVVLGVVAGLPARCAIAWFVAWPLTQVGLLVQPELTHFGGLSGALHAGVAVVAVELVVAPRGASRAGRADRVIGALLLTGLVAKVLSESPWGAPLRHPAGWDIAVAPLAHASGLTMGTVCSLATHWVSGKLRHGS